jgi:hypothetical protein
MNKIDIDAHIGKSCFFQVVHFIKHSKWGVGYFPHVMTKLKRDENFASLNLASKVSCTKGLQNVWDNQNWTRSSPKNEHEKEII